MKYKLIVLLFFLTSCTQNYSKSELRKPFSSKGFAYIYNDEDFNYEIHNIELTGNNNAPRNKK